MRASFALSLLLLAAAASSCGETTNVIDTSQGSYACDSISGTGARLCRESSWAGGAYATSQWASECKDSLGKKVDKCDRTGSVGGCQTTINVTNPDGVGVQLVNTYWFYEGNVATLMASCMAAWVSP